MEWPLRHPSIPVAKTPTWSAYYLAACPTPSDPTIVWGTDVPVAGLDAYLKRVNEDGDILILPAHVLVWAVGRCLDEHPEFNRRVLHRRLYNFRQVNVLFPLMNAERGPEVCLLCDVDRKPLAQIAREIWQQGQEIAKGISRYQRDERIFRLLPCPFRGVLFRWMLWGVNWLYLPVALWGHRACRAGTMVNYLGQRGAPPIRIFKPSRFPNDAATLSVTMGPVETGGPNGPIASLIVRGDHRIIDAYQLGQFVGKLRRYLMDPASLEPPAAEDKQGASSLENAV
jgi:hypothetical protein